MTSLNCSQKCAAVDRLESVRIYITHGLAGRENQMPRARISAGRAGFRMAIKDGLGFASDDIAVISSPALGACTILPFPLLALAHSTSTTSTIAPFLPVPQPKIGIIHV